MTTLCKLIARYYSSSYRGFTLELLSNYIGRSTILESRLETFIHSGFHWTLIRPAVSASDLATVWRYRNSITIIFGTHHNLFSALIISGTIPISPAALPFFISLSAFKISSFLISSHGPSTFSQVVALSQMFSLRSFICSVRRARCISLKLHESDVKH